MSGTPLSGRQVLAVLLCFVIFMGGMFAYVFTALPSSTDPVGSRRSAVGAGLVAGLATIWLIKIAVDAIRDRRQGIVAGPLKTGRRFHLWFGGLVALCGVACSAITYFSAVAAGGGIWTLYYGMILWGLVQMARAVRMRRDEHHTATRQAVGH